MTQPTNDQNDVSDVKKAAEQADVSQIKQNLAKYSATDNPESLNEEQKTPFINEDMRTDQ